MPSGSPRETAFSWKCHDCPAGGLNETFMGAQLAAEDHAINVHGGVGGADLGVVDAQVGEATGYGVPR